MARVQLDLVPQGTFSERIRAGGAGIPAFFTPTGVGTVVADGKEAREFDGRTYIMERALKADFAFVKAWKGDTWGNLVYRKTARNFNPMMATAAKVTIAEVEHLVQPGELDPDMVHTPSVYVNRIFQGKVFEKRIEKRTVRKAARVARRRSLVVGRSGIPINCDRQYFPDDRRQPTSDICPKKSMPTETKPSQRHSKNATAS